ncbi:DUF4870 domain-containing protein (plasmid) [Rossellomorea sp. AcN35-11]|nr:DUF4870 domain-containing protein [Rossellomorea aquimaris]WJV32133.1 DUF4870 domain-containing protein [Rossellomorea sp. AcN35-11]
MENESKVESNKKVHFKEVSKGERQWAMLVHLSSFLGYVSGFGFILAPLVLWLLKKENSEYIDHHGKQAVNFQLSLLIYGIVAGVLCIVLIGLLLLPLLFLGQIILTIVAGVQASEGKKYGYPLTITFIK